MSDNSEDRRAFYQERVTSCDAELAHWGLISTRLSRFRGLTFFAAALFAAWGSFGDTAPILMYALAATSFLGFIALIVYHESVDVRDRVARERRALNRDQLNRLGRQWNKIPEQPIEIPTEQVALAKDLDLFGHASLFKLICNAQTPIGRRMLRDWLLVPADGDEIQARQEAVQQLTPLVDLREELAMRGRLIAKSGAGPDAFMDWVEGKGWLEGRAFVLVSARVLALANLISLLLLIFGIVPPFVAGVSLAAFVILSMIFNVVFTGHVHEIFNSVDSKQNDIQIYRQLIDDVSRLPIEGLKAESLKAKLGAPPDQPQKTLHALTRIMRFANLRRSSLFGVFHILLQILFLIDYQVLIALERWQRRHRAEVRPWFEAIGELECLASLATLSFDEPRWCQPKPVQNGKLTAQELGHPLLGDSCVRNSVEIGPAGTFLLVTGSNMSGKSTLLRAIGLNATLAQAGAVVCATEMSCASFVVATSMRIHDSLEDGVSFFMAELKRLKQIVDQSNSLQSVSNRTLLFLLDEILQGTNSVERHIAVTRVLNRLVENGATGAVSTHDLELADSPELSQVCQTVHFRETIHETGKDRRMTFDYKMRSGVATTTNALKLLELIGLGEQSE